MIWTVTRPVINLDKRNMATPKFWRWCHVGKLWRHYKFPKYGQFRAIQKPNSGLMVCKIYIFIKSNLLSYKDWKKNQKISNG